MARQYEELIGIILYCHCYRWDVCAVQLICSCRSYEERVVTTSQTALTLHIVINKYWYYMKTCYKRYKRVNVRTIYNIKDERLRGRVPLNCLKIDFVRLLLARLFARLIGLTWRGWWHFSTTRYRVLQRDIPPSLCY